MRHVLPARFVFLLSRWHALAGTRIAFAPAVFNSEGPARAQIASYIAGAPVQVAYDPADPVNSVLDRTRFTPQSFAVTLLFALVVVVLIGMSVYMLAFIVKGL